MFIGHFGVGFGAKRVAPAVSLGTLFVAAQWADLVWPTLVLTGVERVEVAPGATAVTPLDFVHYPWSHSLLALVVWAAAFAVVYGLARRDRIGAWTLAGAVVSHWVLDVLTHRPDVPLAFGKSARIGLGLWNSVPATVGVEGTIFVLGVILYARTTAARDRIGSVGLWTLVAFLVAVYAANLLGPPPQSGEAVAWSAEALWLLVLWGWWVDRHRTLRGPALALAKAPARA